MPTKFIAKNDTLGFLQARLFFLENDIPDGVIVMGGQTFKLNKYANPIDNVWPWVYTEESKITAQIITKQIEKRKNETLAQSSPDGNRSSTDTSSPPIHT